MDNLAIYNALKTPPKEALRKIENGRLKGKTDINPMWRIKALTEQFGPCGIGWKYEITRQWTEQGAGNEISAFCNINLYIKIGDTWSDAIPGTGGSAFVAQERNGLHTSDECYKMALTDAISVAAKALGTAADIYWDNDPTKYSKAETNEKQHESKKAAPPKSNDTASKSTDTAHKVANALIKRFGKDQAPKMLYPITGYKSTKDIPDTECDKMLKLIKDFEVISNAG